MAILQQYDLGVDLRPMSMPASGVSVPTSVDYGIIVSLLDFGRPPSGQRNRGRHGARLLVRIAALIAILLSQPIAAAPTKEIRRILILNEVGTSYPAIPIINQGIETALHNSPYRLEFYSEYMDALLFPDKADQQEFRDFYLRKYQNRKPDVIITIGPSPLKFMQEVHQKAFPGVPIVFCLPNGSVPGAPELDSDFTGVENDLAPAETLEVALRLQPATEHVVVVNGGISTFDKQQLAAVKQQLKAFPDHVDITYVTGLAIPELLERLKHLPKHTVVLFTAVGQDATGNRYKSSETLPMIAAGANAPVFTLFDVYMNHGEVGGYLSNLSEQGKVAGGMALRMLKGDKPRDIPPVKGVNTYMFDWRALKRWGLNESALPPGSILINRQPTVWESYKWYIIGGVSLILLEALLIGALLRQRVRTRRSEEYSRHLVLRSPVAAVVTRGSMHKNELVNDKYTELFGYTLEDVPDEASWWLLAYPDEAYREAIKSEWRRRVERALIQHKDIEPMEGRVRCKDGSYRHIEFHFASFADSKVVKFIDVTERKAAQEALADVGRRLIEAHEEERAWIGRELHDDISQRIALTVVELQQYSQEHSKDGSYIHEQIGHVEQRLSDLGKDVQALSHRLHSSKLDYLGLTIASLSFCREFSEQQQVEIDFTHEGMPSGVPKEISLCLFRILQEALQNAVKYSGVRHFTAKLEGAQTEIQLTITDDGVGFDQQAALRGRGLGLTSMRERIQLVKGELSITSQPDRGTTVCARAPFVAEDHPTSLTG